MHIMRWIGVCVLVVLFAVDAQAVMSDHIGDASYTVKRTDIGGSSVTITFGFESKKVALEFPVTNSDEVCVDWKGATAVCPSTNTAGDDRFAPGSSIIIDKATMTSISFISSSGTQTVYVRAWR